LPNRTFTAIRNARPAGKAAPAGLLMRKALRYIGPAAGLALFGAALFVLHNELRHYSYRDIAAHIRALPPGPLFLAVLCTALNYLILTGYDALGFAYIGKRLEYRKIAMASFAAYSYSNNIGLAALSGGSIRFRLYSGWGLSSVEIAQVISFGILTFWLGLLTASCLAFTIMPPAIPAGLGLPFTSPRPLGFLFLLVLSAYSLLVGLRKKPVIVNNWALKLPTLKLTGVQMLLSALDWGFAAGVLFLLLPPSSLTYFDLLSFYLLAQVAGLISQVPGGLGVFETVIMLSAGRFIPAPAVLGSLFAYRVIYYLLPLITASALLAWHEISGKREWLARGTGLFSGWVPGLVPPIMALLTFLGGMVLLFSGATPAQGERLALLTGLLPLPVLELSHFLASLGGLGLLILARGLQRRLDASYHMAVLLLGGGVVLSLLKGLDIEEALVLAAMLGILLPCKNEFKRKTSLLNEPFNAGWIAAIALVLAASAWLGLFSYKHVEYTGDIWWRFEFSHDAPRFLRATVGISIGAVFFSMLKLLRPVKPKPDLPGTEALSAAFEIAGNSPDTGAYLSVLGDKELLFNETKNAFIMYGTRGRSRIALGDPVGPQAEVPGLLWKFIELCQSHGDRPVFYQVSADKLADYVDLGFSFLKLGENGKVALPDFTLEGKDGAKFRQAVNKVEKEGFAFEVIARELVPGLMPELRSVSDAWLREKNTREKGFSLGFFDENYLGRFPCAAVKKEGRIFAFANVWPGGGKEEISLDLMRYAPGAPGGVMDYLFIKMMLWGKEQGYRHFDLGMAPLSGLQSHALAPLRDKLGAFLYRHGEHFYNFKGLRNYKEKFGPVWEPKYLASRGGLALPGILLDVTALISRGIKGAVLK